MNRPAYLPLFLFLNFGALVIGSSFTADSVASNWYQNLSKAPWTPPGWVFGAAWTFLMVWYSMYLAFAQNQFQNKRLFWGVYLLQWVLNVAWNPLFFKYHWTVVALIDLLALSAVIYFSLLRFIPLRSWKAWLLLPYALWVLIATSLNAYIVLNN
ncbi:MAG: TspO/MBR family protein [Bacteroidota bacterium]